MEGAWARGENGAFQGCEKHCSGQRENSNIAFSLVFNLFERSPVGFLVGIVFFCLILFLLGVLMKYENS